ncbi:4Fe-4S dicluster domain-containing protein [Candidatus Bathyarchaeota archaeon]|nr:MAG: hypothetical protein B6U84_00520 [Candidatus Bathyarchaeota archaeon ex4484_40]RJS77585.1 MAG: 4Fe-4S dicluster domain-containing protein [Candidatus Bathyarchaeota archaeon]
MRLKGIRGEGGAVRLVASTGGKGGTGKSTFAVLYALSLSKKGRKVLLCDCDVECPNDHLLLGVKLQKGKFIYRDFPRLNAEKCVRCGLCSKACKENAIFWVKGKPPMIFDELCSGCGACWTVCPQKAIEREKKPVGEIFETRVDRNLWLITGMSKPGISETGPVVRDVKKRALELAEDVGVDILIVDTAPGTHCNVIQALLGCDKAYVVTEPTPLGAHDASLILELLKIMGISSEIVLNKADVGKESVIEEIAESYGVRITVKIPYSEELVRAYSEGRLGRMVNLL